MSSTTVLWQDYFLCLLLFSICFFFVFVHSFVYFYYFAAISSSSTNMIAYRTQGGLARGPPATMLSGCLLSLNFCTANFSGMFPPWKVWSPGTPCLSMILIIPDLVLLIICDILLSSSCEVFRLLWDPRKDYNVEC